MMMPFTKDQAQLQLEWAEKFIELGEKFFDPPVSQEEG